MAPSQHGGLLLLEGGRRVRVGLLAGLVVKRGITNGERGSETFLAITLGVGFELTMRDLRTPSHGG
jgi:hypothetical protein